MLVSRSIISSVRFIGALIAYRKIRLGIGMGIGKWLNQMRMDYSVLLRCRKDRRVRTTLIPVREWLLACDC